MPTATEAHAAPPVASAAMSAQFIFTMRRVSRFHPPDREVLKDITLAFYPGAKIGVIGANGAGKSSLLRIMAGVDDGFTGEARLTDGFTVGLLEQEPTLDESKDVQGNIMDGVGQVAGLLARYDEVLAAWGDPDADYEKLGDEQADLEKRIEAAGAWDLQRTIEIAIDALRLPPGDADVSTLSGGERRRVALCRLLLSRPDLLLLDEPTNHLDAESVAWLERTLKDYHGTVVAITHDRYFLDNVAGWILELDHGKGIPYEGNYSGWLEQKQARLDAEQRADSSRRRTLERELEWVRMAPKARQAKGKARLAAYDRLVAEAADTERRDAELPFEPDPDVERDRPHRGQQCIKRGLAEFARDLARHIVVPVEPEIVIFGLQRVDDIVGCLLRGFLVGGNLVGQAHADLDLLVGTVDAHGVQQQPAGDQLNHGAHGGHVGTEAAGLFHVDVDLHVKAGQGQRVLDQAQALGHLELFADHRGGGAQLVQVVAHDPQVHGLGRGGAHVGRQDLDLDAGHVLDGFGQFRDHQVAVQVERGKSLHRGEAEEGACVFSLVQDPAEHQLIDVRDFIETGIDHGV